MKTQISSSLSFPIHFKYPTAKIIACNEESELYLKLMIGRHLSEQTLNSEFHVSIIHP
ncbi:MAG: hypothetical protein HOJ14_06060 [Nitrospina sp.]|nr:hypothetical protein [Nitrospina sp.]